MKTQILYMGIVYLLFIGCEIKKDQPKTETPYIQAAGAVEAGRYLVTVGGCNDCHTDGYMQTGGKVPEADWLAGSPMGWRGPWGTTYAANLRFTVQNLSEDQWVKTLQTRQGLPPMPWSNVNKMNEKDARAIYAYIKSLGPKGQAMPLAVASGVEPVTPYLSMMPLNLPPESGGDLTNE